jgi:hypothetical protein
MDEARFDAAVSDSVAIDRWDAPKEGQEQAPRQAKLSVRR